MPALYRRAERAGMAASRVFRFTFRRFVFYLSPSMLMTPSKGLYGRHNTVPRSSEEFYTREWRDINGTFLAVPRLHRRRGKPHLPRAPRPPHVRAWGSDDLRRPVRRADREGLLRGPRHDAHVRRPERLA